MDEEAGKLTFFTRFQLLTKVFVKLFSKSSKYVPNGVNMVIFSKKSQKFSSGLGFSSFPTDTHGIQLLGA